jgi:hypothetical protein
MELRYIQLNLRRSGLKFLHIFENPYRGETFLVVCRHAKLIFTLLSLLYQQKNTKYSKTCIHASVLILFI